MIKRKCFLIDDGVYSKLQELAKTNRVTTGGMVRRLVDSFEGQPRFATNQYAKWLCAVTNHAHLFGPDAAEKFIEKYPAPR